MILNYIYYKKIDIVTKYEEFRILKFINMLALKILILQFD